MYYADDMMMGCRGERKKRMTNIVYEINQENNNSKKSRNGKWGLVSSLTFHGIFTFFWGKKWRGAMMRAGWLRCGSSS